MGQGKKLDADAENDDAMEVGDVDDVGSEGQRGAGGWEATGRVDREGYWWPDNWGDQNEGETSS